MDFQNNFNSDHTINTENILSESKNTNTFLNNKENVLMFSCFDQRNATIVQLINTYILNKNTNRLLDAGMLKDNTRLFEVVYEILSNHKCRVFLLINDFSSIKYFIQGLDIAGYKANLQVLSNSKNLIHKTLNDFSDKLFDSILNFGFSGTQSHLDNSNDKPIRNNHFDSIRLGQMINKYDVLDEVIEYADGLIADLSVIRQSDLPGKLPVGASGVPVEMFNQIMLSAGRSNANRFTIISGFDQVDLLDPFSVDTIAQGIYYYLTGVQQQQEMPLNETVFVVEEAVPFENIHFYKNEITNKWSVVYPNPLRNEFIHFRKIPCTYDDYIMSSKGDLSPRIHDIFVWLGSLAQ